MGFWQNVNEVYPSTDDYNSTSLGGLDLRGLKVRIIETHTEDLAEKVLLAYYGTKQGFS